MLGTRLNKYFLSVVCTVLLQSLDVTVIGILSGALSAKYLWDDAELNENNFSSELKIDLFVTLLGLINLIMSAEVIFKRI